MLCAGRIGGYKSLLCATTLQRGLRTTNACETPKEWDWSDPEQLALYKLYRPERITPHKRGIELLKTPGLNKVRTILKNFFNNLAH